jgi:hypothetical protein
MVFQQVSQHLLVHGTWDSRIVIWYKELISIILFYLYSIYWWYLNKKAMLPNPCYHESEVFLYNPAVHDPRDLQLSTVLNFPFYIHSCIECT